MSKILCTSDWHLRLDRTACRIDDFKQVQIDTLKQISQIANDNAAYIVLAGDIFHRPKEEGMYNIINQLNDIFFYNKKVLSIAGNHDLTNGNMNNFDNNSIGVVSRFHSWYFMSGLRVQNFNIQFFNWDEKIEPVLDDKKLKIAVLHKFISEKELAPWMKDKGLTAKELCEKYQYDVFITGDNHDGFIYKHPETKQIVINPGCITRQSLDKKDYKPRVYLFDTETKNIDTIYLIDSDPAVITTKVTTEKLHLDRETRLNSLVEIMNDENGDLDIDIEKKLKLKCEKNNVKKEVKEEINEILEECVNE